MGLDDGPESVGIRVPSIHTDRAWDAGKRGECIGFGTRQGFVSGAERDGWLFRIQKLYRVQKGADSCITARIHPFMPSFENTAS